MERRKSCAVLTVLASGTLAAGCEYVRLLRPNPERQVLELSMETGGRVRVRLDQYLAVPTGWGGWVERYAPETYGAPRGTALIAFALP